MWLGRARGVRLGVDGPRVVCKADRAVPRLPRLARWSAAALQHRGSLAGAMGDSGRAIDGWMRGCVADAQHWLRVLRERRMRAAERRPPADSVQRGPLSAVIEVAHLADGSLDLGRLTCREGPRLARDSEDS